MSWVCPQLLGRSAESPGSVQRGLPGSHGAEIAGGVRSDTGSYKPRRVASRDQLVSCHLSRSHREAGSSLAVCSWGGRVRSRSLVPSVAARWLPCGACEGFELPARGWELLSRRGPGLGPQASDPRPSLCAINSHPCRSHVLTRPHTLG